MSCLFIADALAAPHQPCGGQSATRAAAYCLARSGQRVAFSRQLKVAARHAIFQFPEQFFSKAVDLIEMI
jgi:hypothetical protein